MSAIPLGLQYLVGTLMILAVLAIIAALWTSQRRMIVCSAILSAPNALSALLVVPHYWQPPSVLVIGIALEDVLFMVGVGGFAWVYAVLTVHSRIVVSPDAGGVIRRYVWVLLGCGVLGTAIAQLPGPDRMHAILLLMALVPIVGVAMRPELWPMAVLGGVLSAASYASTMVLGAWLWPEFMRLWRPQNLFGPALMGVPLEEYLWGALYGPSWAVVMAYLTEARIEPKASHRFR